MKHWTISLWYFTFSPEGCGHPQHMVMLQGWLFSVLSTTLCFRVVKCFYNEVHEFWGDKVINLIPYAFEHAEANIYNVSLTQQLCPHATMSGLSITWTCLVSLYVSLMESWGIVHLCAHPLFSKEIKHLCNAILSQCLNIGCVDCYTHGHFNLYCREQRTMYTVSGLIFKNWWPKKEVTCIWK